MLFRHIVVSSLVIVIAAPVVTPTARACGPPACSSATVIPADDTSVPSNLPAFYFAPSRFQYAMSDGVDGTVDTSFVLVGPGDSTIPVEEVAQNTYRPQTKLLEGVRYSIRYREHCSGYSWDDAGRIVDNTFTTLPESPLPASLGSLRVSSSGLSRITVSTTGGSCTKDICAAWVSLRMDLADEVLPFLPITFLSLRLNDHLWWGGSGTGGLRSDGTFRSPVRDPNDKDGSRIHTCCGNCWQFDDNGVEPGSYTVTPRLGILGTDHYVVGMPTQVEVECPAQANLDAEHCHLNQLPDAGGPFPDVFVGNGEGSTESPIAQEHPGHSSARVPDGTVDRQSASASTAPRPTRGGCASVSVSLANNLSHKPLFAFIFLLLALRLHYQTTGTLRPRLFPTSRHNRDSD